MTVWVVRAGRHGGRQDFVLDNGICAIGWDSLPDLSTVESRENLQELMEEIYPDHSPRSIGNWIGQVWSFIKKIQEGDLVVLPLKPSSVVAIGEVTGAYQYENENPEGAKHVRSVDWKRTDISRTAFDADILGSLGAYMTVYRVRAENAEERIRAAIDNASIELQHPPSEEIAASIELVDLNLQANDQIRSFINRRFRGHDFAYLVAAVLEAKGYKVNVSPAGADGGVDIIAGKGAMGFDGPRMIVQVKSGAADISVTRELRGVMDDFKADHALIVSWGGFARSASRDARQLYFKVRFWNSDDFLRELKENYDSLPEDIQAKLPLKRIWILVPEEAEMELI